MDLAAVIFFALSERERLPRALNHSLARGWFRGRSNATYFHVRIGDGRPSRQDGGPDFGRGAGRGNGGPHGPRGLRGPGHHRNLRGGRRNHHQDLRRRAEAGARSDPRHRLHRRRDGIRREDLRRAEHHPEPVAGYRHGRGYGRRRRPGPDVRLRLRRDPGVDAAAHHAGAQAGAPAERSAPRRHARFPAARTARAR